MDFSLLGFLLCSAILGFGEFCGLVHFISITEMYSFSQSYTLRIIPHLLVHIQNSLIL
jgi:hypothetical protein